MKALKRALVLTFCVAPLLTCLAVFGWKFSDQSARQKRDAALIAAVKASNPPEVAAALAQGADANARDVPPDTRTLWQQIQAMFHDKQPKPAELKSALALAIEYDLAAKDANERATSFAVLKMLHDRGAKQAGANESSARQFAAAEAALTEAPDFATVSQRENVDEKPDPEAPFRKDISQRGFSAQAYRGLALCRFHAGHYEDAARAYRIAQLWQPDDRELAAKIADAEKARDGYAMVAAQKVNGMNVIEACPFSGEPGRMTWAALCGSEGEFGNHAIHVALYRQSGKTVRRLALSDALLCPRHNSKDPDAKHDFIEVELSLVPLTRRRLPEILVSEMTAAGSVEPTHLHVLEWRGNRFRSLLSLHSNWPFWIEKGRQGGAWVIRNEDETGANLAHNEMPERRDFHAYNGDHYIFADAQYPGEFADYIQKAEERLVKAPDDYDLLYNLAYLYRIRGQRQKSEDCYRKALRILRSEDAQNGNKAYYQRVLKRAPPGNR